MNKSLKYSLVFSQILFIALLPIWIKLTHYLHPIVIVIVWFCFTSLLVLISLSISKKTISISKPILNGITVFYSIGLLILLFFRPGNQSYGPQSINLIPFHTILFYFTSHIDLLIAFYNLAANIGLFIPFGLYYCYVKNRPSVRHLIFITLFSIFVIEELQYLTKRGSFDIDDIILNVLGVYFGYLIYPLLRKVVVIKTKLLAS